MITPAILVAYITAIATAVSVLISTVIKPLIEAIPAFSPRASDQRAHDAILRLINLLLNVAGVLIMAAAYGQLNLGNWEPLTLQVILGALGSHTIYNSLKPSGPPTPQHQQDLPTDGEAII